MGTVGCPLDAPYQIAAGLQARARVPRGPVSASDPSTDKQTDLTLATSLAEGATNDVPGNSPLQTRTIPVVTEWGASETRREGRHALSR